MIFGIIGVPLTIFGLIFALYHLSTRQRNVGREVITPANVVEAKDVSVVGIVQPIEEPGKSPSTGDAVVWLRAFKTFESIFRSSSGSSSHVSRIGKINLRFALVDEVNPDHRLVVDSKRISEIMIMLENRRYNPDGEPLQLHEKHRSARQAITDFFRFHLLEKEGVEERAIRPGDRLWAHGRIRERDGELVLYGFQAWLDDRPPVERVAYAGDLARMGGYLCGTGAVMVLIGWLVS